MKGIILTVKENVAYFDDMKTQNSSETQLETKDKPESRRRYMQNM